MLPPIDPALSFMDLNIPDTTAEVPDVFTKLFEDGALAYQLGGDRMAHARVARFREQAASQLDIQATQLFKNRNRLPTAGASKAADDWNEEIVPDDSHVLAKMESSFDRKKRNYSIWMREQIALGKSAGELIDFAAKTDAGVARLLREVAEELEAA